MGEESKFILLTEWRWEKLYKQIKLAELLGFSQELISRIENGTIKPSIDVRKKFIETFGEEEYKKIKEFN